VSANPLVISAHALDIGGGEGLVADAQVVTELECRALSVATSVVTPTALPPELVAAQLAVAKLAGAVGAIRIGFVRGAEQIERIADFARGAAPTATVVATPVRDGTVRLLDEETSDAICRHLYPIARVVVARAVDLPFLADREIEDLDGLREAASRLRDRGAKAVVIAGWLSRGRVLDLLDDEGQVVLFDTGRIHAPRVPGLAGAYAAALTAHTARGLSLQDAAAAAQRYIGFRLMRGR
jgi:hydroxymethylpyrimidine kinase/phosphomethylpyrimidine kinase